MKLLITLAWRNLWRNRRRSFITISSVLFAVLLAIIFYSMEQGSYERMIDSMVKYSTGYIQIQDVLYEDEPSIDNSLLFDEQILGLMQKLDDKIDFYVPRIQNFALAAAGEQTRVAMVMGIEPAHEARLNDLFNDVVSGGFLESGDEDILVAEGLADILEISVGDTLILLGQGFQGATAAGKFRVKGIANLRIPEMNNNTVYMSLQAAQWLYMADNRLTALIIMPENPKQTHQLAALIRAEVDDEWYRVLTWDVMLADLLALMKFDIAGTMVMMGILYIVITFGLFGTILTMMIERQREFAMLFALGMKRAQLAVVCFLESVFITFAGIVGGMAAALPILLYFFYYPIQLSGNMADAMLDYGFEPVLPFSLDPVVFTSQAQVVMVISILVGLYPVYRVYRLGIMEARQ
jgi:putative ABC transport system permease protein